MLLAGMSYLTNKDELWDIIQAYQNLTQAKGDYKTKILNRPRLAALRIDAAKVKAANDAAGCQLYSDDGVPNTLCLQSLSQEQLQAVSKVTGISVARYMEGKSDAKQAEAAEAGLQDLVDPGEEPEAEASGGFALEVKKITAIAVQVLMALVL